MSTRSTHMVRFLRPPYLQRRRLEATLHPATTRAFRGGSFWVKPWEFAEFARLPGYGQCPCGRFLRSRREEAPWISKKFLKPTWKLWCGCDVWCVLGTAPSHLAFCTRATRTPPWRPMKIEGRGDCRGTVTVGSWIDVDRWSWRRTCLWAAPYHGVNA